VSNLTPSYQGSAKRRTIQQQVAAMFAEGRRLGVELPDSLHSHYGQDVGRSVTEMAKVAEGLQTARRIAAAKAEEPASQAPIVARTRPVAAPKPKRVPKPAGDRAARASAEIAAFARERGEITAEMVAERFGCTVQAGRVRLWRAADRGALIDIDKDRKRYRV
jgi:hypothetical protein